MAESRVENSAQVLSYQIQFICGLTNRPQVAYQTNFLYQFLGLDIKEIKVVFIYSSFISFIDVFNRHMLWLIKSHTRQPSIRHDRGCLSLKGFVLVDKKS